MSRYNFLLFSVIVLGANTVTFAEEVSKPIVTITKTKDNTIFKAEYQDGEYSRSREFFDGDHDGWCDLWCAINSSIKHRNRKIDTDQDGLSDFQEMALFRDPLVKGPMPKEATLEQKASEAKRLEEVKERKEVRAQELLDELKPFIIDGDRISQSREEMYERIQVYKDERAAQIIADIQADQPRQEAAIKAYEAFTNEPRRGKTLRGKTYGLISPSGKRVYKVMSTAAAAADTISTDELLPFNPTLGGGSSNLNLNGTTRRVAVWEEGDVVNLSVLNGRVTDQDGPSGFADHSTSVAGVIGSSGAGNINARGMAPAVQIDSYDFFDDVLEIASYSQGSLSNHSYSIRLGWGPPIFFLGQNRSVWNGDPQISETEDFRYGHYGFTPFQWDNILSARGDLLPVFSAGNDRGAAFDPGPNGHLGHVFFDANGQVQISNIDRPDQAFIDGGYDTLSPLQVSKNSLVVGSIEAIPGGYNSPADVVIAGSSSWGPTDDGRIKPDIVANGVAVLAPLNNGSIVPRSGTSFSAPSVCGSIALLQELYLDTLGLLGGERASLWKALVIHTADEAGDAPGPDYKFGWGVMNTLSAAQLIQSHAQNPAALPHIKEMVYEFDAPIEFKVTATGNSPLKVTMCWTDSSFTNQQPRQLDVDNKLLETDLDLRISDDANTYFPWRLNVNNTSAAATKADNDRDNVEQVVIDNPIAGQEYTISVSHKGLFAGGDDFVNFTGQGLSMIITGNEQQVAPEVAIDEVIDLNANSVLLDFKSVPGAFYDVQSSTDLVQWNNVILEASALKDTSIVQVGKAFGSDKTFYRIIRTR